MKAIICPTITAESAEDYKSQLDLVRSFASRIHIDCMDGKFAPTKSPDLSLLRWPKNIAVDLHIMYQHPMKILDQIIHKRPHLTIVHAEADHASSFVHELHEERLRVGIAILPDTPIEILHHYIKVVDHVLIFSGHLGYHGGHADLSQVQKVLAARKMRHDVEIGWDGGINDQNISMLKDAGVQVFNVGSGIHGSPSPQSAYVNLSNLVQS